MELLLNLLWLLLSLNLLAACWMADNARSFSGLRRLVLAICICLLVFPVVSASDDLRALATECEESSAAKPGAQKHTHSRTSSYENDPPASLDTHASHIVLPSEESRTLVGGYRHRLPSQGSARHIACRPPPCPNRLELRWGC